MTSFVRTALKASIISISINNKTRQELARKSDQTTLMKLDEYFLESVVANIINIIDIKTILMFTVLMNPY